MCVSDVSTKHIKSMLCVTRLGCQVCGGAYYTETGQAATTQQASASLSKRPATGSLPYRCSAALLRTILVLTDDMMKGQVQQP